MRRCPCLLTCLFAVAVSHSAALATLKVDVNPDNGRADVRAAEWENWPVPDGPRTTRTFGALTVSLRTAPLVAVPPQQGNRPAISTLTMGWWKPGFDHPARMASDGVYVKTADRDQPSLEMVIAGLPPGRHGIVTWHNSIWDQPLSRCNVYVNGVLAIKGLAPSLRLTDDYDAASAFVEVVSEAGKEVVLRFEPEGSGQVDKVILKGFAMDAVNPARQVDAVPTRRTRPDASDAHLDDGEVRNQRLALSLHTE